MSIKYIAYGAAVLSVTANAYTGWNYGTSSTPALFVAGMVLGHGLLDLAKIKMLPGIVKDFKTDNFIEAIPKVIVFGLFTSISLFSMINAVSKAVQSPIEHNRAEINRLIASKTATQLAITAINNNPLTKGCQFAASLKHPKNGYSTKRYCYKQHPISKALQPDSLPNLKEKLQRQDVKLYNAKNKIFFAGATFISRFTNKSSTFVIDALTWVIAFSIEILASFAPFLLNIPAKPRTKPKRKEATTTEQYSTFKDAILNKPVSPLEQDIQAYKLERNQTQGHRQAWQARKLTQSSLAKKHDMSLSDIQKLCTA